MNINGCYLYKSSPEENTTELHTEVQYTCILLLAFVIHESATKALYWTEVAQSPIHYWNPRTGNIKKVIGKFQVHGTELLSFLLGISYVSIVRNKLQVLCQLKLPNTCRSLAPIQLVGRDYEKAHVKRQWLELTKTGKRNYIHTHTRTTVNINGAYEWPDRSPQNPTAHPTSICSLGPFLCWRVPNFIYP